MTTYSKFVADIGGTHARFALVDDASSQQRASLVEVKVFKCADFGSPAETVIAYQNYLGGDLPSRGCIAAAGPVSNGEVQFTNLEWHLSAQELQQTLKLKQLEIVNDFAAVAYSVASLAENEVLKIHPVKAAENATRVVLGAGTGLGLAALINVDGQQCVMASEGGHTRFAPADVEEAEILSYLLRLHSHVSMEMLLSGPGVRLLYRALGDIRGLKLAELTPDQISACAIAGSDAHSVTTLNFYINILASFCASLAVTFQARGGLYLTGDIFRSLQTLICGAAFRERYLSAGMMSDLINQTPLTLVLAKDPGLQGAADRALRL